MAKTKISEFSSTPGNNTDIDSINIAEGCAPSGINNAIRELMAQLKDFQAGTAGDSFNGPIGTTTAAAGAFTTLSASSTVSGTGFSNYLASPPAIGGTAAAAGSFTTLTTSSTVTHNGGTANGVAYLNGSKVLTTGSALTFDGSQLDIPAGSAASPSLSTPADVNTGLYFPAADTIGLSTNGAERFRLDSSGNLGLGVTPSAWSQGRAMEFINPGYGLWNGSGSPASMYMLANAYFNSGFKYGGTGQASHYYQYQGAHVWSTAPSGTAGNAISFTQAMTLDASGNLAIGHTSPSTRLDVVGSSQIRHQFTGAATGFSIGQYNSSGDASINNGANAPLLFATNNTERARIDSSGNLLIQSTSSSVTSGVGHKIRPDAAAPFMGTVGSSTSGADVTYSLYSTGAAAYRFYVGYNGTISATTTTISGISDQRLKENIQDLDAGLDKIMELKPRKFDWKAGKGKDIKGDRGFIAQEFEQVFPDLIDTWRDPAPEGEEPYKSVRADLIPVLVKAIQEQQAIITALTARVAALESN